MNSAHFNDQTGYWDIATSDGEVLNARFCIMATGCLSSTNTPKFEGLSSFEGPVYHTGNWPHEKVDFAGKTVAMIGTGSSAVQSIPLMILFKDGQETARIVGAQGKERILAQLDQHL